ncbi:metallophosphoesterase family protein [Clostridium sp. LBM24168]
MKYIVMSDIHGNLEALTEIMKLSKDILPDKFIILGDIVGYMCNPNECIDMVRNFDCVMGNHDYAVTHPKMLDWFNPLAGYALQWTRNALENKNVEFLGKLPYRIDYDKFTVVHGDITSPGGFNYILGKGHLLNSNFDEMQVPILFVGHTHCPNVFIKNKKGDITCIKEKNGENMHLDILNNRYIINVGSVGQPRDGSTDGCCVIFDDCAFDLKYIRFGYDIDSTVKKMIKNNMPELLYKRLYIGR